VRGEIVTVVGLGLMGGSLAAALKQGDTSVRLRGVDTDPHVIAQAVERQIVDEAATDLACGVSGSTVVVLATPVRTIIKLIGRLGPYLEKGCFLLDLGSTKVAVVEAMAALPAHVEAIGGHPLCGRESSGLAAADAALYQDKVFVLCPLPRTRPETLARAEALVRAVGARPLLSDPARHDRLVATTSHLPYLLAVSLIAAAEKVSADDSLLWKLVASGFRDASRLAASDVTMMTDILMTNRTAVSQALAECRAYLDKLAACIEAGDEGALQDVMQRARRRTGVRSGGERS